MKTGNPAFHVALVAAAVAGAFAFSFLPGAAGEPPQGAGCPPVPPTPAASQVCVTCHVQRQPGVVLQHNMGVHARKAVGCADCHGTDHDEMFRVQGAVPVSVCAKCHPKAAKEFEGSVHYRAHTDAMANPAIGLHVPAMQRRGCLTCHADGAQSPAQLAQPGSGRCNTCHPAHRFDAAEARSPEACGLCHRGPDHPSHEAWEASPHGIAWRATRDTRVSPTCVTCHMAGGTHDVSGGMTLGKQGSGAVLEGETPVIPSMRILSPEKAQAERKAMLAVCTQCHVPRVAQRSLEDADAIKREADRIVGEASQVIHDLDEEGLVSPAPRDRVSATVGHAVVPGVTLTFQDQSDVERLYFDLAKLSHAITFKSAYHQSPDWTHWSGMIRMKMDLDAIRAEARRLRAAKGSGGSGG